MNSIRDNYKTDKKLTQRTSLHAKYSTNKVGYSNWIVSNYQIQPNSTILELGGGNGSLWKNHLELLNHSKLILTDFSAGMIDAAMTNLGTLPNIKYQVANIEEIPFEDNSFDLVIANSMLYYVPDLHKGLSEVRRVLKPEGTFYCATYGEHGHTEFIADTLKEFGVQNVVNRCFTLQNGMEPLKEVFTDVKRVNYEDSLAITNIDDLIEYIYSCVSMTNVKSIPPETMKSFLQSKMVEGVLQIPKEYGMFICR